MTKPNLGPWRYNCSYVDIKKDHYITHINGQVIGRQVNQNDPDPRRSLDEFLQGAALRRYGPGKLVEREDGSGFDWAVDQT